MLVLSCGMIGLRPSSFIEHMICKLSREADYSNRKKKKKKKKNINTNTNTNNRNNNHNSNKGSRHQKLGSDLHSFVAGSSWTRAHIWTT